MSTRAAIGRPTDVGWVATYHHLDGYPTGLGAALFDAYHTAFDGDLARMTTILIDDHRGGWSTIIDADWSQAPGFIEYGVAHTEEEERRPKCYCHGDRHEGPFTLMQCRCGMGDNTAGCDPLFIEYAYVLFPQGIEVWSHAPRRDDTSGPGYEHIRITFVPWDSQPDWGQIERDVSERVNALYA